jgi:hypothetical protein
MPTEPIDLSNYPPSTRMRWYAVMNAWGTPDDLPFDVEPGEHKADREYRTKYPRWNAAARAIQNSLTEQQMSWGWWREQKLGDFEQWCGWWESRIRTPPVAIDEEGNPL